mmetsp:Transcript_20890/g.33832  ORF Transcript_20890/g.33832 Transcript_20890/m.33832 type:complete len:81 (-) Transcript_20890:52-294(-)
MHIETTADKKGRDYRIPSKGKDKAKMRLKPMVVKIQNKEGTRTIAIVGRFKQNRSQLEMGTHWAVMATGFTSCFQHLPLN